jgi:hypothetical protein
MSESSETIFVRGVRRARFVGAVEAFRRANGLERVPEGAVRHAEARGPDLQRVALRRDGKWLILADTLPDSASAWGEHLSRFLGRSVLTLFTWDGEATVVATRWKAGKVRAKLELLGDAFRGADGRPRAPAKVLWPWLEPSARGALLRDGIPLRAPGGEGTGDAELDDLLEEFDDVPEPGEDDAVDGDHVFVPIGTSVLSLGAPIGLRRPFLDPCSLEPGDEELVFRQRR